MENLYSKKQFYFIGFSSLIIAVIGLISSFSTYFILKRTLGFISEEGSKFSALYWIIKPLLLFIGSSKSPFDVWEVFMCVLLLAGSFIFFIKKGKDTRLIAFVFSVILLSNIIGLLNITYYFLYVRKNLDPEILRLNSSLTNYFYPFIAILYITVSFMAIKMIKKGKVLDVIQTEASTTIRDTPKWQRFFHLLIDTLIMLLVFCPLLFRVFETYLKRNETFMTSMNNEFSWLVIIFVFRLIYYPFFELIFGSTPAKLLTESRVVNYIAEKPTAGNIFQRTVCRSIPFNAISFFWKRGWHDSLSNTYVVKEKRTGYKTSYLLLILVFFVPYMVFYYYGDELLEKYEASQVNEMRKEYANTFNRNSVENINSDQAFALNPLDGSEYRVFILKVEKVKGDEVICRKIVHNDAYSTNSYMVEELYRKQKDSAETYIFSKKDFINAVPKNIYEPDESKRNGSVFFSDAKRYEISEIFTLSSPRLSSASFRGTETYSDRDKVQGVYIENTGKGGKLVSIKNLQGNIQWLDKLPLTIKNSNEQSGFLLKAANIDSGKNFSAEIIIQDSLNNQQIYRLHTESYPYASVALYRLK